MVPRMFLLWGLNGRSMRLTAHLRLVTKLTMRETICLLPHNVVFKHKDLFLHLIFCKCRHYDEIHFWLFKLS